MRALIVAGCLGLGASGSASALLQSCTVSGVPVGFGTYNPLSPVATFATGTITVECTAIGVGLFEFWTIALSPGNSGNFNSRRMLNGSSPLGYNLYTSAAYNSVWGDGSGSTTLVNGGVLLSVGTTDTPYTVYGRIPAGQDAAAGTFTDTIVVTLNF